MTDKFNIGDLVLVTEHTGIYNSEWDGPFVGIISSLSNSGSGYFTTQEVSFAGKKANVVVYDMVPFEVAPKQNWILRHQGDDMDNVTSVYFVDDTSLCLGHRDRDYDLSLEEFRKGIQEDFATVGYFWRYLPAVSLELDKSYCWLGSSLENYFTVIALSGDKVYYKYGNPLHNLYGKQITRFIDQIRNEVVEVVPPVRGEKTLSEDSVRKALMDGHLGLTGLSANKVIEYALKIEG